MRTHPDTEFFVLGEFDYSNHFRAPSLEAALDHAKRVYKGLLAHEAASVCFPTRFVRHLSEIDAMGDIVRCHQIVVDASPREGRAQDIGDKGGLQEHM